MRVRVCRVCRRDAFTMNMLEIPQGAGSGFLWDDKGKCSIFACCSCCHWVIMAILGSSQVRVTSCHMVVVTSC
jgi:hypothetical protein